MAASLANDWPQTRSGIEQRTREFGMTMAFRDAPDDHLRVRAVVDEWLRIVDADDHAERARLLNRMMAESAAHPYLTDHDGEGWHLHYREPDDALPLVLRAVISVGTSLHLVGRGMHRLGRCAADPCTNVVVDVTRNGRQRYCSVRCANRDGVRRHRARASTPS
ncbi:putative RNA-binding Zn ribbon-like protein [Microbacterium pseudoresistens]|uniref:Putative RNA-binding Zn ribbon-like protein n=2 Tax=Microbacterium pseudoresistens TaxID=640634 RepID=A0A7Y9EVW2_9MICO|nr:putative RNA-binding Zn ribbon-like protein [Microbacterium pseudoresistens]